MKSKSRQQRKHFKPRKNIKKFVVAGTLALAGIVGILYKFDEVGFHEAKNNFRLRQEYLSETIKEREGYADGLEKIEYDHSISSFKNGDFSTVCRTFLDVPAKYKDGGKDLKTRIEVYRRAFEETGNEDEFLSILIDHEYRHTDQVKGRVNTRLFINSLGERDLVEKEARERMFDVNGDLFRIYLELDAYSYQLSQFPERKITEGFREKMTEMYNSYVDSLYSKEETFLILSLRKTFVKN